MCRFIIFSKLSRRNFLRNDKLGVEKTRYKNKKTLYHTLDFGKNVLYQKHDETTIIFTIYTYTHKCTRIVPIIYTP